MSFTCRIKLMKVYFLLLLVGCNLFFSKHSESEIPLGTFSLATEAGWVVAFELKKDNIALITPAFDSEETPTNSKPETIMGNWKIVNTGIEIFYKRQGDLLRLEKICADWKEHPCFRFEKSLEGSQDKSLLKFDYPYINWDWKNPKS